VDLASKSTVERSSIKKVSIRLVPFVALMFFINYLDRTAISFAGPNGMNEDLGLTAAQYGFASGVFFIGYIILEIPSNMALHKFGARRWLARIMVSWGLVAALFAWVQTAEQLYILRFALGVAEAGFFPGAILFLSLWVPTKHRSKILALFYLAQPLTTVLGAPLAGWLLGHDGAFGLEGWRFMYLMVAIPAIVVGVIAWFYLPNKPTDAKWLNNDEQQWLTGALAKEAKTKTSGEHSGDAQVGPGLLVDEPEPTVVLGDSAYGSGDARAELAEAGHQVVIKPIPLQAAVSGGFTMDDFIIDETAGTATCPNGLTRRITKSRAVVFGAGCNGCPLRAQCTTSTRGRIINVHPHEVLLRAARRQAETPEFQTVYRQHRPMVERSIAWLTRGNRRVRYRGVRKNDHWLHHRVAGLNLRRLLVLGLARINGTWVVATA